MERFIEVLKKEALFKIFQWLNITSVSTNRLDLRICLGYTLNAKNA